MHITITDIVGEKTIDLSYLIQNFDSSKEVTVVGLFSDNIQYEFMTPWMIELELGNKPITAGTYTRRKLTNLIEGKIKLTQFDKEPRINKIIKLAGRLYLTWTNSATLTTLKTENLATIYLRIT